MTKISRTDIELVRELNHKYFGNRLSEHKEHMIFNRLKRLFKSQSKYGSISQMLRAVSKGEFTQEFINIFTTNKTSFFRELIHFEDMTLRIFPNHFSNSNQISIYSCASSTGEEPYSIATTFLNFQSKSKRNINATVYATDIDTNVLKKAKIGIYKYDHRDSPFPRWILPQNFFQKRVVQNKEYVLIRANNKMRELMKFSQHNLMSDELPFTSAKMDVIFCRNVLIYFTPKDQKKVLTKLFSMLHIGGTLYTGHSESPSFLNDYVEKIGPSIYKKLSNIDGGL